LSCELGEEREEIAPTIGPVDHGPYRVDAISHSFQIAVFELDARRASSFGDELHLDFGHEVGIVFPFRRELPGQHEARRWIPHEHLADFADAAVYAALEPAAALPWLDNDLIECGFSDVMAPRPPAIDPSSEHFEGTFARRIDVNAFAHGGGLDGSLH